MARTTKKKLEQATSEIENTTIEKVEPTNNIETGSEDTSKSTEIADKESEVTNNFSVLLEAQAKKLSPKSEGHITFQLIKDNEDVISLQLLANTSGGNFSKNPVPLKTIIDVLTKQPADKAFKSSIIKDVFIGKGSKSSNNSAFLISALRTPEIGLIVPNEKSKFLSNLSKNFKNQSDKLLSF